MTSRTLSCQELVKVYSGFKAVNGVSIEIQSGEIVGLLGPNGAGKTTTFYMLVGLIKPNEGTVYLDEHDISQLPMYRRARLGLGYLSQEPSIFRRLSVEENIMAILEAYEKSPSKRKARLHELLGALNIEHLAKRKATKLSGGERRRVEIARSLVTKPAFLLLDEPFSGIDPIAVADIQEVVSNLRTLGLGVLITDHNVRETLSITNRSYIMFEGRILKSGTSQELAEDPEARAIYLGERFKL